ncbi:Uncharacterised protein [Acetobacterium wieringae]|jgi:hypothetical protein|nr:Uncharacterised protein [Acetobacterium wieringae]
MKQFQIIMNELKRKQSHGLILIHDFVLITASLLTRIGA